MTTSSSLGGTSGDTDVPVIPLLGSSEMDIIDNILYWESQVSFRMLLDSDKSNNIFSNILMCSMRKIMRGNKFIDE